MLITIIVLIIAPLIGGMSFFFFFKRKYFLKYILIFAGSYLFAITFIHLIPEVFMYEKSVYNLGILILLGFFVQQVLEYFSSGIEHGHSYSFRKHTISRKSKSLSIILSLTVHSMLEGALLVHESSYHSYQEFNSLLLGIAFHKIPIAFTLVSMTSFFGKKNTIYALLAFCIASPIGLLINQFLQLSEQIYIMLMAIVSGGFLHISTTIFVESTPDHHFQTKKILIFIVGVAAALFSEYIP